jgi:hypothetical protein
MSELKNYIDAVRRLPLDGASHEKILGGTAGGVIEARLVLLTPGYSCLYSISPIRKLPVLFYRSTVGLAKLAST